MNIIKRKESRKTISVFLVFVMVATVLIGLPVNAQAAEIWDSDDFIYEETDNTIIKGFSESGNKKLETNKDLVIPSSNTEGKQITKIGQKAFLNKGITSVVIPDGVQNIGIQAFAQNSLTKVEIPSSVNYLDSGCFMNNQISEVNISKDVRDLEIVGMSFALNKIKSINLPYNTKNVGPNVFKKNTGMDKEPSVVYMYTINSDHVDYYGISEVGGQKLKYNSWSSEDFTYEGTTVTGFSASGQDRLNEDKKVEIPKINSDGQKIVKIADKAFLKKGLTKITISDGIQNIGTHAFAQNSLTKVEIPSSVNYLGSGCFMNNQISEVNISKDVKDLEIVGMSFALNKIKSINLPYSTKNIGANAFKKNTGMDEEPSVVYMYTQNPKHIGCGYISENAEQKLKFVGWSTEDFTYDGTTITGFSKKGEERLVKNKGLVLPQTNSDGKKITKIETNAFSKKGLTSVEFPNGLNSLLVGAASFSGNEISKVTIPEGVTELDSYSFIDNKITSLQIPSTIVKIGNSTFKNNEIHSINISEKVNKIQIDGNAFASNKMKSLDIPISIEKLTKTAFLDNTGMDEKPGVVYMYTTNPKHFKNSRIHHMDSEIENNKSICQKMILKSESQVRAVFADKIADKVIEYNTEKEKISLPKTIILNLSNGEKSEVQTTWTSSDYDKTKAGEYIFTAEYNLPNGITGIKPESRVKVIVKKEGSTPDLIEDWKATDFTYVENSITGLSEEGKSKARLNKDLVIPDKTMDGKLITEIGENAFNAQVIFGDVDFSKEDIVSPSGFKTVILPSNIKIIKDSAFQYNNLGKIDFPQGLEKMGEYVFMGNRIDKLSIPDSVTEIGTGIFGVNPITSVKLSNNLKKIPQGAFTRDTKLTSVVIPNGVTIVEASAFTGCPLAKLELPTSLERIERLAFNYHRMSTINIPGNVKYIGEKAFAGTTKGVTLKKLVLGDGIEEIGRFAFEIGLLKEVNIPSTIKRIDPTAFKKNAGMEDCDSSGGMVYLYTSNKEHLNLQKGQYHKFIYKAPSSRIVSDSFIPSDSQTKTEVSSITGVDRYDTAIKISKEGWSSAENVVLINNSSISDALSATPFAKEKDAPILLTPSQNINQQTLNELKRLKTKNIYIVGGENSIDSKVEKYLQSNGYKVTRISGIDRYDTSIKIANELGKTSKTSEIAIVNGEKGLADAVSIGAVAAEKGMPVLLTNNQASTKGLDEFIKNKQVSNSYIIGGKAVLEETVENKLPKSTRISGINRKETNSKVIEKFYSYNLNNVYVAKNGINKEEDLVDALSVGVLASKKSSPVMLVSGKLSSDQKTLIKNRKIKAITQVGGNGNEESFNEIKELTK